MAKRPSKHLRAPRPLVLGGFAKVQRRSDGEWFVQSVAADAAVKTYRCPGCQVQISPGTAHCVVWSRIASIGSAAAVDERRHWHNSCWQRRR